MIKTDQGWMITSLLNWPYKKIILDRFIIQDKEEVNLITEPKAVLSGLAKHYENQFRKINTKLEEMSKEWKEVYEPKGWINETWYRSLEETIVKEEWKDVLKDLKSDTAPEVSSISYILIKQAGKKLQKIFRAFANLVLEKEKISKKWKIAQVYLIPKDVD